MAIHYALTNTLNNGGYMLMYALEFEAAGRRDAHQLLSFTLNGRVARTYKEQCLFSGVCCA